ncbi:MAG: type IX secretion system periplasmic lipoprotein PorW/SprE, partial [Bacteroidia bacterium]
MRRHIYILFFTIFIAVGFGACKRLKDSKLNDFYHNVTARFNGYFNGKEKMLEVEARLFEIHPDNYNTIIDVFPVGDEQTAKSVTADLDIIIKKGSRVILKHPNSNWVDDAYFLIAKANYYKRDYFAALESFEYLQQRYPKSKPGMESPLWIIRCYLQMEKLNEAQAGISALNLNKTVKPEIKEKLHLVESDYFIKTEQYERAAEKMELAMPHIKTKKYKARYNFILAQLYQKIGNNVKATDYYKAVIKKNPVYELAFQAKIGLADVSSDKNEVERYLKRLTKDEKNLSYNDQIYYVLAKSELKANNIPAAIEYLKQSVASSQQNRNQKALSYLLLADVYFSQPNYPYAKAYYDSAAKIVDKTYPGYEKFKNRQETLSALIGNLIIIEREDSLLKLSQMPEDELKAHIKNIIAQEQLRATQNLNDANNANIISPLPNNTQTNFNLGTSTTKNGYFSDASALARGSSEFINNWGKRPLADDWRRKDKPVANIQNPNNPIDTFITNQVNKDTTKFDNPKINNNTYLTEIPADQQRYYQSIPFTTTQKNISVNRLQEALFAVGNIYFTQLNEPGKAAFYFEELIRRFPNTKNLLAARYNLYRIYTAQKETAKAEEQKQFILTNFPGSDYAQLIENPDQLRDKFSSRNKNQALETLYAETYAAYKNNQCAKVKQNGDAADRFEKNYLKPKFEYLNIICQYRYDSTGRLIDSLRSFTKQFPGDEVTKQAVGLIEYLENKKKSKNATTVIVPKLDTIAEKPKGEYKFDDGLPHFYLFVYPAEVNENLIKTAFSNLNASKYSSQKLEMTNSLFDTENQILLVRNFVNFKAAYNYHDDLQNDPSFYKDLKLKKYD